MDRFATIKRNLITTPGGLTQCKADVDNFLAKKEKELHFPEKYPEKSLLLSGNSTFGSKNDEKIGTTPYQSNQASEFYYERSKSSEE